VVVKNKNEPKMMHIARSLFILKILGANPYTFCSAPPQKTFCGSAEPPKQNTFYATGQ